MKNEKVRKISKTIKIISKICYITSIVGICAMLFLAITIPVAVNKTNGLKDLDLKLTDYTLDIDFSKNTEYSTLTYLSDNFNNTEQIIIGEVYCVIIIVGLILLYILMKKVYQLFSNIEKGDTPFTKENIILIKSIAKTMILFAIIPGFSGSILEEVTKFDIGFNIDIISVMFVLIIYALSYIFEYGYNLQLESDETL